MEQWDSEVPPPDAPKEKEPQRTQVRSDQNCSIEKTKTEQQTTLQRRHMLLQWYGRERIYPLKWVGYSVRPWESNSMDANCRILRWAWIQKRPGSKRGIPLELAFSSLPRQWSAHHCQPFQTKWVPKASTQKRPVYKNFRCLVAHDSPKTLRLKSVLMIWTM